jgi:hypothetical protein
MLTKIMVALCAVLIFGAGMAALAVSNAKVYSARVAPAAIYGRNAVVGYDTSGAAIFRGELTPACPLSLKQQSRC